MDPLTPPELDRHALFAALRARLARADHHADTHAITLAPAIDQALPAGGLACAAIHEILAVEPGAAAAFTALALARSIQSPGGTVFWIAPEPDAWPPGLLRFGLAPENLVLVQASRPVDGLWAMEECLRCPGTAGAALTLEKLDMTAARRLQLAAEAGGALGLLLRPDDAAAETGATAALTRWRVGALPGAGGGPHDLGDPRWRLELLRGRGAKPQGWDATWRQSAERLDVENAAATTPAARPKRRATAR